jgi:hypothetical protein
MFATHETSLMGLHSRPTFERARIVYFNIVLALMLTVGLASFVRHQGPLLSNVSFWLSLVTFVVALSLAQASLQWFCSDTLAEFASAAQCAGRNEASGVDLSGVDCSIGFVAAWALKGGPRAVRPILQAFLPGRFLRCTPGLLFRRQLLSAAIFGKRVGVLMAGWPPTLARAQDRTARRYCRFKTCSSLAWRSPCCLAPAVVSRDGDRTVRTGRAVSLALS